MNMITMSQEELQNLIQKEIAIAFEKLQNAPKYERNYCQEILDFLSDGEKGIMELKKQISTSENRIYEALRLLAAQDKITSKRVKAKVIYSIKK